MSKSMRMLSPLFLIMNPPAKQKLILNLPLDVSTVSFEEGFSRDVTNIGHWGCGAVELYLQSSADFEKAKSLIDRAFDEN